MARSMPPEAPTAQPVTGLTRRRGPPRLASPDRRRPGARRGHGGRRRLGPRGAALREERGRLRGPPDPAAAQRHLHPREHAHRGDGQGQGVGVPLHARPIAHHRRGAGDHQPDRDQVSRARAAGPVGAIAPPAGPAAAAAGPRAKMAAVETFTADERAALAPLLHRSRRPRLRPRQPAGSGQGRALRALLPLGQVPAPALPRRVPRAGAPGRAAAPPRAPPAPTRSTSACSRTTATTPSPSSAACTSPARAPPTS